MRERYRRLRPGVPAAAPRRPLGPALAGVAGSAAARLRRPDPAWRADRSEDPPRKSGVLWRPRPQLLCVPDPDGESDGAGGFAGAVARGGTASPQPMMSRAVQ